MTEQGAPRVAVILVIAATFIGGYLFSLWFLHAYHGGDQVYYVRFYDSILGVNPAYWGRLQNAHLGSAEPFYRYIVGIPAYFGVDRVHYLSFWNGVLMASIGYALLKFRASLLFTALAFTNYYLLVIVGPAERLKFAYIALLLAFCVNPVGLKYVLSVASVFFHTQAVVQFGASVGAYVAENRKAIFSTPLKTLLIATVAMASLGAAGYLFLNAVGDVVALKSETYTTQSGGIIEAVQWAMLLIAGTLVFRNKLAYIVGMLPLGAFTMLYGNRVNVATLAFFALMAMIQHKTNNPIVLAVMAYMSYKSVQFVSDVMAYGTGYL